VLSQLYRAARLSRYCPGLGTDRSTSLLSYSFKKPGNVYGRGQRHVTHAVTLVALPVGLGNMIRVVICVFRGNVVWVRRRCSTRR
jgi:hypothetical protein